MGVTRYCIGLSTAAARLQETVGWAVKDRRIEEKLGVSWYTFYRWRTREEPQSVNERALNHFLNYYSKQVGTAARVKVFEDRDAAVRYQNAKGKLARSP